MRASAEPFVKWAGGKGQLVSSLSPFFPKTYGTYFEPFLGGGAVFFALRPKFAVLSDSNADLINTYKVVQSDVEALVTELEGWEREYRRAPKSTFRKARDAYTPSSTIGVGQATLFLFLNRTCYNGLYRVNQSGEFNVPIGRHKHPTICDEKGLRLASRALDGVVLRHMDYARALDIVEDGDFVYLDPPYHPVSKTANFVNYTQSAFNEKKHEEMILQLAELNQRVDCKILVSSSDVANVGGSYAKQGFKIECVMAPRRISCKPATRGKVRELLIRNYDQ